MKSALVVILHGSPYPSSNEPALLVVNDVRERGVFGHVAVGFLECNKPSILEAIRECVEAGAQRIIALPYFLHLGTHVVNDIPEILESARSLWPHVEFRLTPPLGRSLAVTAVLAERARAALAIAQHPDWMA